jgi:CRISPR/Cas system-associated exonuclease Cas4 (RecB family)
VARPRLAPIRASEVGEYLFCARAWWLRRVLGLEPAGHERRELGTGLHRRHGRTVAASNTLLMLAAALALAALALIVLLR